jgi:mRNA interferase MazF
VRRGDLYRVAHPSRTDPKRSRVFVVVSRQVLCDTAEYSTVICAPIASSRHGLATQVPVGEAEGLKHASAVHCDGLVSLPRTALTHYVGRLGPQKLATLHVALKVALDLLD